MAGYKSYKRVRSEDEDSDDEVQTKPTKTTKKVKTVAADQEEGKDSEGNPYWNLSAKRRVGISKFKQTTLINIREFWTDKDGEFKPGKKGISLSVEQYNALVQAIPAINAELASQGLEVADIPSSVTAASSSKPNDRAVAKEKRKPKKSNIEATSDEDEEEEED